MEKESYRRLYRLDDPRIYLDESEDLSLALLLFVDTYSQWMISWTIRKLFRPIQFLVEVVEALIALKLKLNGVAGDAS